MHVCASESGAEARMTTLVLGAGGPWGVAWMTGLIMGLEDGGVDLRGVAGTAVLDADLRSLRARGSRVHLIVADETSLATRSSGVAPDPESRKAAAEAGRLQGRREVSSLLAAFSLCRV